MRKIVSTFLDIFSFFLFLFLLDKSCNLSKIVLVLLFASVERFFVSHMRDFFCHVAISVCVCVYLFVCLCNRETSTYGRGEKNLVKGCIANFCLRWIYLYIFFFGFLFFFWRFWSHPSVDHHTVDNGGIRREGSVAVAVIVSDKWHITCDTWHGTCDMLHARVKFFLSKKFYRKKLATRWVKVQKVSPRGDFIVLLLLSTSVEIVGVNFFLL